MDSPRTRQLVPLLAGLALLLALGCAGSVTPADLVSELADLGNDTIAPLAKDSDLYAALAGQEVDSDAFADAATLVNDPLEGGSIEQLERDIVLDLGEASLSGETLAMVADMPPPSAGGTLMGRFVPLNATDTAGRFRGVWEQTDGSPTGFFRGRWRTLRPVELPENVVAGGIFHGVYVGMGGELRGVLRGAYGENADGDGRFVGRWFDPDEHLIGGLRGAWQDDPNAAGGVIMGHWVAFDLCDELDSLPAVDFDPNDFGGYVATGEPAALDAVPVTEEGLDRQGNGRDRGEIAPVVGGPPPVLCSDLVPAAGFRGQYRPNVADPNDPNAVRKPGGTFQARWGGFAAEPARMFGHYEPLPQDPNLPPPPLFPDVEDPNQPPAQGRLLGLFYGKVVTPEGTFVGFVRGRYGLSRHGVGLMRGRWLDADGGELGRLEGHWLWRPRVPGGPLRGVVLVPPGEDDAPVAEIDVPFITDDAVTVPDEAVPTGRRTPRRF